MRYSKPFAALMFMAGPMIIITLVNGLYGIVDKQLTLNFAISEVGNLYDNFINQGIGPGIDFSSTTGESQTDIFKQVINVSTQYSNSVVILLSAISMLTAVGTAISFGRHMGGRNQAKMNETFINGIIQTFISSFVIMLIMYFLAQYLLVFQSGVDFSNKESALSYSLSIEYCRMFVFGFPLLSFGTFFTTMLRTEGKIYTVIIIQSISLVINIILGYIFLDILKLGMAGAVFGSMVAWSFMIIASIVVIIFSKNTFLKPQFSSYKFDFKENGEIYLNGLGPFILSGSLAIISAVSTRMVSTIQDGEKLFQEGEAIKFTFYANANDPQGASHTEYITNAVRVLSSSFPWSTILYAPIIGIMQGGVNSVAYSYGAKKNKKMWSIIKVAAIFNLIWLFSALLILIFFGTYMMQLFSGPTTGSWAASDKRWWFVMYNSCLLFPAITYSAMLYFNGSAQGTTSTIIALVRTFVFQLAFVFIGYYAAKAASDDGSKDWLYFLCYSFAEVPAAIVGGTIFYIKYKKVHKEAIVDIEDDFIAPTFVESQFSQLIIDKHTMIKSIDFRIKNILKRKKLDENNQEIIKLKELMYYKEQLITELKFVELNEKLKEKNHQMDWTFSDHNLIKQTINNLDLEIKTLKHSII